MLGIHVPVAVSRFARKAHHFSADGERGRRVNLSRAYFWSVSPCQKLPLAYLRESLLVLHLQLLFQGGVEFPTGGKSGPCVCWFACRLNW